MPRGRRPWRTGRMNGPGKSWSGLAIALVVAGGVLATVLVVAGLAIVGVGVVVVSGMNLYGSNK